MTNKRLVNCDFINVSSFISGLSNKGKLLYFFFLTNADDKGFVGNAKDIAESLDRCEENFENTLFSYHYTDAISELVDRRLVFEFTDKCNNKVYLIKHWFLHTKEMQFSSTNYTSFLKKVELVDNEYQLKTIDERNPLKGREKKGKEENTKSLNNQKYLDKDNNPNDWDKIIDDINS